MCVLDGDFSYIVPPLDATRDILQESETGL